MFTYPIRQPCRESVFLIRSGTVILPPKFQRFSLAALLTHASQRLRYAMRRTVHSDCTIDSYRLAGARMLRSNAKDGGFEILESGERFPTFERRIGRGHVGLGIMDDR